MSILMTIPDTTLPRFVITFKIRKCEYSNCFSFSRFLGLFFRSLKVPYEFESQLANFDKEVNWDFHRDCVKCTDNLETFTILTILSHLIH